MANFVDQGFSQLSAAVTTHVMKLPRGIGIYDFQEKIICLFFATELCLPINKFKHNSANIINVPAFCDAFYYLLNKQM